jgi:hypothetical protein
LKRHKADSSVNQSPAYLLDNWTNSNCLKNDISIKGAFAGILSIPSLLFGSRSSKTKIRKGSKIHPEKLAPDDYILKTAEHNDSNSPGTSPGNQSKLQNIKEPVSTSTWKLDAWKNITGI